MIRHTEDLNVPFLTKQGWKVLTQLDNIWVRIVKAKYLHNGQKNFFASKKKIYCFFYLKEHSR